MPTSLPKLTNENDIEKRLAAAVAQYKKVVENNHGIKEENLRKLLVPLSIRLTELDQAWISNMSSFGTYRGQIVHKSSIATTQLPDPKTIFDTITNDILPSLEQVDKLLQLLCK